MLRFSLIIFFLELLHNIIIGENYSDITFGSNSISFYNKNREIYSHSS